MEKSRVRVLLTLFWKFLCISTFIIGGGYAIIVVADRVFARLGWTEEGELLDHLPVFQMVPGLIATHSAVYIGNKACGALGAVTAVIAVALPAVTVFTFVAAGYDQLPLENHLIVGAFVGLRSALTGIILATIIRTWTRNLKNAFAYAIMIAALAVLSFAKINVALVLLAAAMVGIVREFLPRRKSGEVRFSSVAFPFLVFLKYGCLAFGGGFVLVPLYIQDFVGAAAPYLHLEMAEFSNVMALSQMTPGPIGVNAVTFFGFRLASVPGALAASALLLLPGSIIVFFVLRSLEKFKSSRIVIGLLSGIRPATISLMLVALVAFASSSCTSFTGVAITLAVAFLSFRKTVGVIQLILGSGLVGIIASCL